MREVQWEEVLEEMGVRKAGVADAEMSKNYFDTTLGALRQGGQRFSVTTFPDFSRLFPAYILD